MKTIIAIEMDYMDQVCLYSIVQEKIRVQIKICFLENIAFTRR